MKTTPPGMWIWQKAEDTLVRELRTYSGVDYDMQERGHVRK